MICVHNFSLVSNFNRRTIHQKSMLYGYGSGRNNVSGLSAIRGDLFGAREYAPQNECAIGKK